MRRAAVPRSQLHARARPPSAVPTGWTSTPPVSLAATRAPGARAQAHGARRTRTLQRGARPHIGHGAAPSGYNVDRAAPHRNGTGARSGRDVLVRRARGQRYLEIPVERADGADEQEDEEQHTPNFLGSDKDAHAIPTIERDGSVAMQQAYLLECYGRHAASRRHNDCRLDPPIRV